MKDYSIGILQPGQTEEVNVFGNYIRNIGTGSIKVVARNTQKTVKAFSTTLGAGGWRSPESEYNHWTITNDSNISLPVSVLIGKGEAGESEVKINADVTTKNKVVSLDKRTFLLQIGRSSAAGYYQNGLVWNPPQSGINVLIKKIYMGDKPSSSGFYSFAMRSDTVGYTMGFPPACRFINNYLDDGAEPVFNAGYMQSAYQEYTSTNLTKFKAGNYEPIEREFAENPIIIPQGVGLVMVAGNAGELLDIELMIREEVV
jgi:hypothetical protein